MQRAPELLALIEPIVKDFEAELWGLEQVSQGDHTVFRVYVEKKGGIEVGDCAKISQQVSSVLTVEFPQKEHYILEVSSPGMDRVLFTPRQMALYVGKIINVRMHQPIEGRRNFTGELRSVNESELVMNVEGQQITLSIAQIGKARLVPQW